MLNSTDDV